MSDDTKKDKKNDNIKYGLIIFDYDASSIFGCNTGTREYYNRSEVIFANSLFSEFICSNGLKRCSYSREKDAGGENKYSEKWSALNSGLYTRDIICVHFDSTFKNLENTIKDLEKKKKNEKNRLDDKIARLMEKHYDFLNFNNDLTEKEKRIEEIETNEKLEDAKSECEEKINSYDRLISYANAHKENFPDNDISTKELRKISYEKGITIRYPVSEKKSENGIEEITYRMLYRSTGKAKDGSCMFINEKLYDRAIRFLRMGRKKLIEEDSKIVDVSAYQTLVASNISGHVEINPDNILVIKDEDSVSERNVVRVKIKDEKVCLENGGIGKVTNTLWDGQALIDKTVFDKAYFSDETTQGNGYLLLRQHFFKAAAFCTDIKQFFRDYCTKNGKDYETCTVTDLWGKDHFVKDIELITTENALKWMKFSKDFDKYKKEETYRNYNDFEWWRKRVNDNSNIFGIVKTAHESKQGEYQRMSYQMVNVLDNDEEILQKVVQCSIDYVMSTKNNNEEFLKFLKNNSTFSNDFDVLVELCKKNRYFIQSEYLKKRKKDIIYDYAQEIKSGHIIQKNADNLVIVGSPYAMLLKAAEGKNWNKKDPMFETESGEAAAVQCWTERFKDGAELAEFRSPFNSRNNLGYMRNKKPDEKILKYFRDFGRQIIAVNMTGTDFQARNNGSDQDSDSIYTTDQPQIVACTRKFYREYPTIINEIPQKNDNNRNYSSLSEKYAEIDNDLSEAQSAIGRASNLAQLSLTYSYSFPDEKEKFEEYVCILSVLAQVAIDNAKRHYAVNLKNAIDEIKAEMDVKHRKYPEFWKVIRERSRFKETDQSANEAWNKDNINMELKSPMSFIYNIIFDKADSSRNIDNECFFVPYDKNNRQNYHRKAVEDLVADYGLKIYQSNVEESDEDEHDSYLLMRTNFEEMINRIRNKKLYSFELFSYLIDRALDVTHNQIYNPHKNERKTNKNRSLLIKTLYTVSQECFFACFGDEKYTEEKMKSSKKSKKTKNF